MRIEDVCGSLRMSELVEGTGFRHGLRKLNQQWQTVYSFFWSHAEVKEGEGVVTTRDDKTKGRHLRK